MSQRRSLGSKAASALLTVAAVGGVLCIVFVALAAVFNITLIMFKTGSMGPGIPAGSLAIVREIPASEANVGDVVTVDRPGLLPVTHRVTSITTQNGVSQITLKGDANDAEDPDPYSVSHVRIVLFAVPQLGYAVAAASNPLVLGGVAIAASGLVTWAFWPRDARRRRLERGADTARHRGGIAAVVILAAGLCAATPAPAANAAVTEEVTSGSVLTLVSIADRTQMYRMPPGVPVLWQVGVSAHAPEPGYISIGIHSSGSLPLVVSVSVCRDRWVATVCPSGGTTIATGDVASVIGDGLHVDTMPSDEQRWVLVEATLTEAPLEETVGIALTVRADGAGDDVSVGGAGSLPNTGTDLLLPLLLATGAVLAGLALAVLPRAARRRATP